jgi:hypothetical protein
LGVGFHTAWDWGQSFLYGTPDSGYLIQDHVFHSIPIGDALLSGGRAGPEGSVLVIPTMAVVLALALLMSRPRVLLSGYSGGGRDD